MFSMAAPAVLALMSSRNFGYTYKDHEMVHRLDRHQMINTSTTGGTALQANAATEGRLIIEGLMPKTRSRSLVSSPKTSPLKSISARASPAWDLHQGTLEGSTPGAT